MHDYNIGNELEFVLKGGYSGILIILMEQNLDFHIWRICDLISEKAVLL